MKDLSGKFTRNSESKKLSSTGRNFYFLGEGGQAAQFFLLA